MLVVQRPGRSRERGARVGLIARGKDGLEGARADVEKAGGEALAIPTDVAHSEEVEAAAEAIEKQFGPIDIWVNNAMTTVFSPLKEITAEEFKRATEVTYLGTVYGTMAAIRRMYPRNRGTIVQVGSALAYRSIPLQAPYCGAKHAIRRIHRFAAIGADSRPKQHPFDDGADARTQHPAVQLVQDETPAPSSARAADFSAGGRRGSDRLGRTS